MNLIISCFLKDTISNDLTASLLAPLNEQKEHTLLSWMESRMWIILNFMYI